MFNNGCDRHTNKQPKGQMNKQTEIQAKANDKWEFIYHLVLRISRSGFLGYLGLFIGQNIKARIKEIKFHNYDCSDVSEGAPF